MLGLGNFLFGTSPSADATGSSPAPITVPGAAEPVPAGPLAGLAALLGLAPQPAAAAQAQVQAQALPAAPASAMRTGPLPQWVPRPQPTETQRTASQPGAVASAAPAGAGTAGPARRLAPTGAARRTTIPAVQGGVAAVATGLGQSTWRQATVSAGPADRTLTVPAPADGGARVEVFAVRDWRQGNHRTQVLEPVEGRVTVPAGSSVRFMVRVTGTAPGDHRVDAGVATVQARVAARRVEPLPMMTWVNGSSAEGRGSSAPAVERVLAQFGVAATGSAATVDAASGRAMPRHYLSAAWEAATKQPVGATVERLLAEERTARAKNPAAEVWVQVSDEQDKTAPAAKATAAWIGQLRRGLAASGSKVKLFVATQPRPHNHVYAPVIDGWAVTQSSAGNTRAASNQTVAALARKVGHPIELMQYPGNAFFDARTPGSGAVSTASAALDGAKSWFLYSANNLDVLEKGGGVEGRGDIGGLVAIGNGRVLPTLALAEAQYGANIGAAARAVGGAALTGTAAQSVRAMGRTLDANGASSTGANLGAWEQQVAALLR